MSGFLILSLNKIVPNTIFLQCEGEIVEICVFISYFINRILRKPDEHDTKVTFLNSHVERGYNLSDYLTRSEE